MKKKKKDDWLTERIIGHTESQKRTREFREKLMNEIISLRPDFNNSEDREILYRAIVFWTTRGS